MASNACVAGQCRQARRFHADDKCAAHVLAATQAPFAGGSIDLVFDLLGDAELHQGRVLALLIP